MARKKAASKPRSPMTDKVFDAFIYALRADDNFDGDACNRVEFALKCGKAVKSTDLKDALFPPELVEEDAS